MGLWNFILEFFFCDSIFRFPFDWNSPIGYLLCVIIQGGNIFIVSQLFTFTLILIFGMCFFATDFVSDIERNLNQINEDLNADRRITSEQCIIEKRLIETCRFHIEARKWVNHQFYEFGSMFYRNQFFL